MDLTVFLILDAVALIVATTVLTYFFLRDFLKEKNNKK